MEVNMRTTLALDDELVAKAQALTGLMEKSSLVRQALKALIERSDWRVWAAANPIWRRQRGSDRPLHDPGRYLRLGRPFARER